MKATAIAVIAVFFAMVFGGCAAQDTSCVSQLVPCLNYLNGTRDPPESCCRPLRSVIATNPDCLCTLISNRESRRAERAGIDVNGAQQLPGRCGEHVNPLACLAAAAGAASFSALQVAAAAVVAAIVPFLWASDAPFWF